jgi:hypothetical protein
VQVNGKREEAVMAQCWCMSDSELFGPLTIANSLCFLLPHSCIC